MKENADCLQEQSPVEPDSTKVHKFSIEKELEKFTNGTDSLVATAPLALFTLEAAHRSAYKEYERFWTTKCLNVRSEGNETVADVPPGLLRDYKVIRRRLDRSSIASKVIANSSLVSLVSQYDSFLGGLLRTFFYLRPEILNASDRALTLKELEAFKSIDAARDFIVEKEVETIVRKSHIEQFDWMENRFNVKLREGLSAWSTFVEVTERRNLLVHCSGIVSSHYISVCQQHGADCTAAGVGTELTVTRAYLVKAYDCLMEIGVKLGHVLWRKLAPEQRENADVSLNLLCLDLLMEGRNALAKSLLDFATQVLKKWSTEVNRLLFVVNRAQSYKWLDDEVTCQKVLGDEDWSAVDDKLSLGVAILRDNFGAAAALMKKIGDSPQLNKDAYREWPIFKRFRKSAEFRKAYKEIFCEDFADVPEHNTVTFQLEFGQPEAAGKASISEVSSKPN
jgi:hypothetical protein